MWNDAVITNAGRELLSRWTTGETLEITRAATGQGTANAVQLMAQTSLVNEKQAMSIVEKGERIANGVRIRLQITSQGVQAAYTINQIGIWARMGSEEEVLLAIYQDSTGVRAPSESEMADYIFTFYATIQTSNDGEIVFTVDPLTAVTNDRFQIAVEKLEQADKDEKSAREQAERTLNQKIEDVKSKETVAGSGLIIDKDEKTINHKNSVEAGTVSGTNGVVSFGGTIKIPKITYDSTGHISQTGFTEVILPSSPSYSSPVTSVNGQTGDVTLKKADLELENVENCRQYSETNPPPYPVTSVSGKTGDVTLAEVATSGSYNDLLDKPDIISGKNGTTFTPSVSPDGILSWTNDGGKENPSPVNIKGAPGKDGNDGAPGANGNGISSITPSYQQTSSTSQPSSWSPTRPTPIAGQYMWTRLAIAMTDGSTNYVYLMERNGSDGADGSDGSPGSNGTRGSNWNSGTAMSGTSTTTTYSYSGASNALVGDYYLNTSYGYVYRCTTAGSGTSAKWTYQGSIRGASGTPGNNGTGISSITAMYAQSSSTSQPSSWSGTRPDPIAGRYMWTQLKISMTDGSTNYIYLMDRNGADGTTPDTSKFVTTDTNQTVTGPKSFTKPITITGGDGNMVIWPTYILIHNSSGDKTYSFPSVGGTLVTKETMWPVGAYYFSDDSTDPGDLFGGSWEAVTGKFLYCNAGNGDGGSNTLTLQTEHIPNHVHGLFLTVDGFSEKTEVPGRAMIFKGLGTTDHDVNWDSRTVDGCAIIENSTTSVGGNKPIDIRPAYQEVYAWRKTR